MPVEWETEVFEKFEKPYKREGAGLALAAMYVDEEHPEKDSLLQLAQASLSATDVFDADSITSLMKDYHHFYLCNRLFLLNLAAIYTTGFECPDKTRVIPELRAMLAGAQEMYAAFNESYPATRLSAAYLDKFASLIQFAKAQPSHADSFDHFTFIKEYVNQLFGINQQLIRDYGVVSRSLVDYSLSKAATSILDKDLYHAQNAKGIYLRVTDTAILNEIADMGKLLFNDPILSGNNQRSCASCHKAGEYFTDTLAATALHYDGVSRLPRNTPSLAGAIYNHLVMLDGRHNTLQEQTKAVISNPEEMNCNEQEVMRKVLSCKDYKRFFNRMLEYTPQEKEIIYEHILSSITLYYSKFSRSYSAFDLAILKGAPLASDAQAGYNLFMGKAQCGTCHFLPQFNGVKPPYVSSEFEVLGVPSDTSFQLPSKDLGRYNVNAAEETHRAFRTGTVRNTAHTAPYMHNGVFKTMEEVIDFYDAGGGKGRGLIIPNQTLAADSLHLSAIEKKQLIAFIRSLDENISSETPVTSLPHSTVSALNKRRPTGDY